MPNAKSRIKNILLRTGYIIGLFDLLRYHARNRVNILMYHRFSAGPEPFKIDQRRFEKQLQFFRKKYNPISLADYTDAIEGRKTLPTNSLVLTIDDGYLDNYTVAFPLLKKYQVPATVFLATDFIDKGAWLWPMKLMYILQNTPLKTFHLSLNSHRREYRVDTFATWHRTQLAIFHHLRTMDDNDKNGFLDALAKDLNVEVPERSGGDFTALTWSQIREMQSQGVEFGSHTCSHPILARIDKDRLEFETHESKRLIESRLQVPVDSFCYPNGQPEDFNGSVVESVKRAGYKCAVTTVYGTNNILTREPYALKRKSLFTDYLPQLYRGLNRI